MMIRPSWKPDLPTQVFDLAGGGETDTTSLAALHRVLLACDSDDLNIQKVVLVDGDDLSRKWVVQSFATWAASEGGTLANTGAFMGMKRRRPFYPRGVAVG